MSDASHNTPYVRPPRARRTQEPVNRMAEDEAEVQGTYRYDTDFTSKVPSHFQPSSYRKSRANADKFKRERQYGQYLSVPKGNRDLFSANPSARNIRAAFWVAIVAIVLSVILVMLLIS